MLPIVLVLLVATSALAAPSINVTSVDINDVAPDRDPGLLVSSFITNRALEIIDGGDKNIYILTAEQVINDLANAKDTSSQALALGQLIGLLGSLATGSPGDACAAAAYIDAYVLGNNGSALNNFIQYLVSIIDLIVQLDKNPNSVPYSAGYRGNCNGGGRTYQFESAWNSILDQASPYQISLLSEQYCAAKRLYTSVNTRSNNVGAIITATSLPPVNSIIQSALGPIANFVRSIGSGTSEASANAAKQALLGKLNNVSF